MLYNPTWLCFSYFSLFLTVRLSLSCLSFAPFFSPFLLPLSTSVSVTSSAYCHHLCLSFSLSPLHSICHPSPFQSVLFLCFSLSVFTSFLVLLSPPSSHRQSSLAAAASFCSLFAANGPLVCCVQGNKSHQAGTQAP